MQSELSDEDGVGYFASELNARFRCLMFFGCYRYVEDNVR